MNTREERDHWLQALTQGRQSYPYQRHGTRRLSLPDLPAPRWSTSSDDKDYPDSQVLWNSVPRSGDAFTRKTSPHSKSEKPEVCGTKITVNVQPNCTSA
mmetsp:Transcript_25322/g.39716  ORF Transcript_25322/g.39716 Transcript_25322/m.39716 type:complete len:99 (-) Transcript_25322:508-804(-)